MRADLLEFPDVLHFRRGRRRQWPEVLDILPADIEESCADRREQPLVQRRAVEIALEVRHLEREMRKGVRAVDDRLDVPRARHARDIAHGKELPRQVRDVADVDYFRLRCDRAFDRDPSARRSLVVGTGNEIFVTLIPSRAAR